MSISFFKRKTKRAAESLLLVLSKSTSRCDCATEAADIIERGVDWGYFYRLAGQHKLADHIYNVGKSLRLSSNGFLKTVEKLKPTLLHAFAHCRVSEKTLSQIAFEFQSANISFIPLKGTILSRYLYGEPYARGASIDIDLLVPESEKFRAEQSLSRLGYRCLRRQKKSSKFQMDFTNPTMPNIDLHWDITTKYRSCLRMRMFWDDTMDLKADGIKYRVFQPESMLLFLFAHLSNVSAFTDYRYAVDSDRLLHIYADRIDWRSLKEKALKRGLSSSLYAGLLALKVLFGKDHFKRDRCLSRIPFFKKVFIHLCVRKNTLFYSGFRKSLLSNYLRYVFYELVECKNAAEFIKILLRCFSFTKFSKAITAPKKTNMRRCAKRRGSGMGERKKYENARVAAVLLMIVFSLSCLSCTVPYYNIRPEKPTPSPPLEKAQLTGTVLYADYYIAPGDRLQVYIWQYPEWSWNDGTDRQDWTRDTVRPDGKLWFPLVGDVQCAGLTTKQLAKNLEKKLSKYVRSPEVHVYVREYVGRYYYVLRAGGGGSRHVLKGPLDIFEAVMQSGVARTAKLDEVILITDNMTDNPKMRRVNIFKRMKIGVKKKDIIMIKPNDIIYIPQRFISELCQAVGEIQAAINATQSMADWRKWSEKAMTVL